MKMGPYRLIIVLISSCMLAILSIQAYWILNLYEQKEEGFNRDVYSALEYVSKKLQEKENLKALRQTIIVEEEDTVLSSTSSNSIRIFKKTEFEKLNRLDTSKKINKRIIHRQLNTLIDAPSEIESRSIRLDIDTELSWMDSSSAKLAQDLDGMKELVDKILIEIRTKDSSNADSLEPLIYKALNQKGLFLPVEFSLRNNEKNNLILRQSKSFQEQKPFFKYDLSADKVFTTHNYLCLQFPTQQNHLMSAIKSSLILSLLFSSLIVFTFFYTIRLLLKQKKITEIKSDFVNNMTHELKTPIATISLALDAFDNPIIKNNETKFREYKQILREENAKLNKHVERVLQMALLDKGQLSMAHHSIDLVSILKETVHSYKLQLETQKAELDLSFSEEQIKISGDAEHLQTAFSNLIDNALKYANEKCKIRIRILNKDGLVKIYFKDNGIGIDKSQQEKIFEKFYRVQGGNLHDVKGFGLGLSYVKSIVEAHGGSILLISEKGKGSEFIITLKKDA